MLYFARTNENFYQNSVLIIAIKLFYEGLLHDTYINGTIYDMLECR